LTRFVVQFAADAPALHFFDLKHALGKASHLFFARG